MTAAFIVLRVVNIYGDPSPRASQSSWTFTMLSFLRTTKYPPSLQFLLMTLGPSLLVLAWFDNIRAWWYPRWSSSAASRSSSMSLTGGSCIRWWSRWRMVVRGGCRQLRLRSGAGLERRSKAYPEGFGYPLWVVYRCWIGVVLAMYPLCKWFSDLKARRKSWWLSYL